METKKNYPYQNSSVFKSCTKGLLILLVALCFYKQSSAGSINMQTKIIATSCADTFYDSGGPFGSYSNSENSVLTVFSATPGAAVSVDFLSFSLVSWDGEDTLFIYDGASTSAPLIAAYTSSSTPGSTTSSAADGSLTFRFSSNNYSTSDGWEAVLSCGSLSACSGTIVAGNAKASATTLCVGKSLTLYLEGFTAASGIDYQWQSSATGTAGSWTTMAGATTIPYTFVPLAGSSNYYRCYTLCSAGAASDTSSSVVVSVAASVLPYFEDFESIAAGSFPSCTYNTRPSPWGDGFEIRDYITTDGPLDNHTAGGTNYLYGGYAVGNAWPDFAPDYFFTPGFELTSGNSYRFSFWYNTDGYVNELGVRLCDGQSPDAAMTTIGSDVSTMTTSYKPFIADFTATSSGYYYFGIRCKSSGRTGFAIDDIGLEQMSDCSGTPPYAGKAKASTSYVCSSPGDVDLRVEETPALLSLNYQWYEADALAGPYTAIAGANTNAYTRSGFSSEKYFYCSVGCSLGGSTKNTDTLNVKIGALTPPYTEDFETGSKGENMPCAGNSGGWEDASKWYLYVAPHPWEPVLENHTTGGSKWLFGGGGLSVSGDNYWFSPAINLTAGKAYTLSYWYITDGSINYSFGARVGISQDASSMTTMVGSDVINTRTTAYTMFSGDFVASLTAPQYIGIKYQPSGWGTGSAIDDIGLVQLPPCSAKPSAGVAKAMPAWICTTGSTTLSLTGLSIASDLGFQWQSSPTGMAGTFTDIAGATLPEYTTGSISVGPIYFRCIVTCGLVATPNTDTSGFVKVDVGPLTAPFIETFETATAGVNQPCASNTGLWEVSTSTDNFTDWSIKDMPGEYLPSIDNHTIAGSKYLSAGRNIGTAEDMFTGDQQYWFSPPMQLTGGTSYKCSYWYVVGDGSTSANFGLYYGSDQNASAMTAMQPDISGESNTSYKQIVGSFTPDADGIYYLGVKVNITRNPWNAVAIDDIGIEQLPLCSAKPTAGTISASPTMICSSGTSTLYLTGASLASGLKYQWQDSSAAGWADVAAGSGSGTPVYTTDVLSSSNKYRFIVTCDAIGVPNADTSAAYLMQVGAITPPYIETFESAVVGVNQPCASNTGSWGEGNGWYLYGAPYDSYTPAIDNHTASGRKYLFADYYGLGNTEQYWFSPAIQLTAGEEYECSYWYSGAGMGSASATLGMYYGLSQDPGSMNAIRSDLSGINVNSYNQLLGRFVAPTSDNYYFGVKVFFSDLSSSFYPGFSIDDIGVQQLPPCTGAPSAGKVSSSVGMLCNTGETVDLDMDLAGVTKVSGLTYRWESTTVNPSAGFVATGTSAEQVSAAYTSDALPSTTWFRCIVKCSNTGDSAISSIIKVDVAAIAPPYIETFEGGKANVNMPCASNTYDFGSYYNWNLMTNPLTYGPIPMDNYTLGGNKYLISGFDIGTGVSSGKPEFWFTPAIQLTAGDLYQFSYWYQTDGAVDAYYELAAFMGTDQTEAGMTTPIGVAFNPSNAAYKQFKNQFTASTSGLYYFGIRKNQVNFGYGIAIDNIGVEQIPVCSDPVVAGSIITESDHICSVGDVTILDLAGSTLATGLTYDWLSAPNEAGPYVSTGGTSLPYTTDPLLSNTWFKAVVICAASGKSDTSAAFNVKVGALDMPYAENFESTPVKGVPLCSDATKWATTYYREGWMVYSGSEGAYKNHTPGGKQFLMAGYEMGSPDDPSDDNYWFTPGLNLKAGYKYDLSFYYIAASSSWNKSKMGVYIGKSQTVSGMTTNIIPFDVRTNTSYVLSDTTFEVPSSGVYYIGFRKSGEDAATIYSYEGVGFDDINLNYAPCNGMPAAGTVSGSKHSGTAYCLENKVRLENTGATITKVPGIAYQWQRRDLTMAAAAWDNISGATESVLEGNLAGFEYRMLVVCKNTNDTVYSPSFAVPQLPAHPPVSITPAASPLSFCLGDTIKFNATNFSGATYDWMRDSVVVPGWKFSDMGAVDPGTYFVKVSSPLSPCVAYSNQVVLNVNDPGYGIDITTPADSIICAGAAVLLTGNASKPGVTFQWRKDNVEIPGATSNSLLVNSSGYYRITASDGTSMCPAVSRNILITVRPNPPALISVPGGTTTACENNGVQLNANFGAYSYEWLRGGSTVVGWTDSVQKVKTSGVYQVKVRTSDGCVNVSSEVRVNILPAPTPVIYKTGLVLGVVTPPPYTSYQWMRNGVVMSPARTNDTLMLSLQGIYKVRVTDLNNCEGESTPIEVMDEGLAIGELPSQENQIRIYPNPTSAKVSIESPISLNIEVKDMTGKTIINTQNVKEIDLSKYADGVYLLILRDRDQMIKQERITKTSR